MLSLPSLSSISIITVLLRGISTPDGTLMEAKNVSIFSSGRKSSMIVTLSQNVRRVSDTGNLIVFVIFLKSTPPEREVNKFINNHIYTFIVNTIYKI